MNKHKIKALGAQPGETPFERRARIHVYHENLARRNPDHALTPEQLEDFSRQRLGRWRGKQFALFCGCVFRPVRYREWVCPDHGTVRREPVLYAPNGFSR